MKKQGNMSILVLFVLVAASLMGILTVIFVNQMLYSTNTMISYYKSYYISNAGLELLLTQAKHRGIGFETTIGTGSTIFAENFDCTECGLTAGMSGTSTTLSKEFWKENGSGCVSPIVLEQGQSLMIPLIQDTYSGTMADTFTNPPSYQNLSSALGSLQFTLTDELTQPQINIGLIILSGDELLSDGIFVRTGTMKNGPTTMQDFMTERQATASTMSPDATTSNTLNTYFATQTYPFKNYLILANTDSKPISFCISADIPLPTDNFHITSNGTYHGQTIGLELIYKQPIPNFLMEGVSIVPESTPSTDSSAVISTESPVSPQ